jgi:hypothetical protein
MLLTGAYGILQFISPMPWDALWMIGADMKSIGQPEPFKVRVFSTLNSPGPYALVAMSGLVLLFGSGGMLSRFATGVGMGSFLLSLVRSAWGGWIVALGYMLFRSQGKLRRRLFTVLFTTILVCIPLFLYQPVADQVGGRAESFSNLEEDNSLLVRLHFMGVAAKWVLKDPIGEGFGSMGSAAKMSAGEQHLAFDNGFLAIPFAIGWAGSLLYFTAVFMLGYRMLQVDRDQTDPNTVVFSAIALALFSILFFTNTFSGISGILLWTFLSMTLASSRYHSSSKQNLPREL